MRNTDKAILYCEEHGILPHKITKQTLLYYANYPAYLSMPRRTYKIEVKLSDMTEKRTLLKKWNRLGQDNLYRQKGENL